MKAFNLLAVTIFVALAHNSFASIDSAEVIAQPSAEATQQVAASPIVRNGIFTAIGNQVDEDGSKFVDFQSEFVVINGKKTANFDVDTLSDQEQVAIKVRADGSILMTTQQDEAEAKTGEPSQFILTPEQFAKLNLTFTADGDTQTLRQYSMYDAQQYARHGGGGHGRVRSHSRHSGGYRMSWGGGRYHGCVAYVASKIGFSGKAGNGVGMASALLRQGRAVSASYEEGAVCSYSGGRHGAGDVCIVRGGTCCYDLGCHAKSMSGYSLRNCVRVVR